MDYTKYLNKCWGSWLAFIFYLWDFRKNLLRTSFGGKQKSDIKVPAAMKAELRYNIDLSFRNHLNPFYFFLSLQGEESWVSVLKRIGSTGSLVFLAEDAQPSMCRTALRLQSCPLTLMILPQSLWSFPLATALPAGFSADSPSSRPPLSSWWSTHYWFMPRVLFHGRDHLPFVSGVCFGICFCTCTSGVAETTSLFTAHHRGSLCQVVSSPLLLNFSILFLPTPISSHTYHG